MQARLKFQALYIREVEAYPSVISSSDAGIGFPAVPQDTRATIAVALAVLALSFSSQFMAQQ